MSYYKKPVYQITNHVLKRFQERHPEKLISSGGQAVLGRQVQTATPWFTGRYGVDLIFKCKEHYLMSLE